MTRFGRIMQSERYGVPSAFGNESQWVLRGELF